MKHKMCRGHNINVILYILANKEKSKPYKLALFFVPLFIYFSRIIINISLRFIE